MDEKVIKIIESGGKTIQVFEDKQIETTSVDTEFSKKIDLQQLEQVNRLIKNSQDDTLRFEEQKKEIEDRLSRYDVPDTNTNPDESTQKM